MNERIFLSPPHMGGLEQVYVKEAFDSNWVAPTGPNLSMFETELASYLGEDVSVAALSSGTAAIHLALILLGVEQGDEVLCSTFTFSGSCNPIVYQRATPVFVDSEPETWNMDPACLREAINDRISKTGRKPKALILVHLYGMPAKLDELLAIASEYNIAVIEDAAEALGSEYKGQKCGTFGDFGVLSFNGNKIITTSGGGALVSKNEKWIEKAKFLATQARDPAPHYQHSEIGFNYRLSNICAGIGRGQLKVLPDRVKERRAIFKRYVEQINPKEVSFQLENASTFSNRWLTTVLFNDEKNVPEEIRLLLEKENIESRPLWKPMHMQPVFSTAPFYGNKVSEGLFKRGICLPSGTNMSDKDWERIFECLKTQILLN